MAVDSWISSVTVPSRSLARSALRLRGIHRCSPSMPKWLLPARLSIRSAYPNTSFSELNHQEGGQAVRQESWQEIESESLLLGKAVTTRRVPESWVVIRKDRR